MSFVHLHTHSHYSFLQALARPEQYIARAKELGMPAVALTDAGGVYGLLEFYQEAKKAGIKPILGVQVFVSRYGRHQKRPGIDTKNWQLILLAENLEGYQNLLKIVTVSYLEGFYYRPRVDDDLLAQHAGGIIALSGNFNGEVASRAISGDEAGAKEAIARYQKIFGKENFFLEILPHEHEQQVAANAAIKKIATETGTPLVAANASHYVRREDAVAHDVVIAIQKGVTLDTPGRFTMMETDLSFKTAEHMTESFADVPDAISNTVKIAERCEVELPLGGRLIPTYQTPFNEKPEDYLRQLCYAGLQRRYGIPLPADISLPDGFEISEPVEPPDAETQQRIIDRLEYELGVIFKMGFASYFLIVWDFVKYAKESGVAVGPGRGSAAGAIISYCLNITNIDPLKYNLLFERFLNPERVSMPDIDIDFADDKREAVLEYVAGKYGRDHVARICTFGTMAAKAAVKDVGRAFGIPFADMNAFSGLIPSRPGTELTDALKTETSLQAAAKKAPFDKLMESALKIEGNARQVGVHACAVVIADKPLTEYTALQFAPGDDAAIITQYSMHPIEDIGLLKMDFLGLRNLTIITKALEIIRESRGISVDIDRPPMDDEKTFQLFARAETTGVFQFESAGMKRYLKDLKPTRFEDLIAMAALFRPGPMDDIPRYIQSKHNPEKISYAHPILERFLAETYGVIVYQEQVQQVAQDFAGFSLGEGYLLIKAVAKKIPALLEEQRKLFIERAQTKGHSRAEAEKLFAFIEPFAHYGFNKAHSACYAFIGYQTGYLKANYPAEYMAALMSADHGNLDRITIDIEEARRMGLTVLPPSVNESGREFSVTTAGAIRFGLSAIKGVGAGPIDSILAARMEGGAFRDIADFASRVDPSILNKRTLEALAFSGALDDLGDRAAIAAAAGDLSSFAKAAANQKSSTQGSLFAALEAAPVLSFQLPRVRPLTTNQKLKYENELLGMYVSQHPLAGLRKYLSKKVNLSARLTPKEVGQTVSVGGIITAERVMQTKQSKESMAFLTLEDPTGAIEVSVFPKVFANYRQHIEKGEMLIATGRLEKRGGALQVVASELKKVDLDAMRQKAKESGFWDDSTGRPDPAPAAEESELAPPPVAEFSAEPAPPFQIRVPAGTTPAQLAKLKEYLIANKTAESGTEILILIESSDGPARSIPLPFRVGLPLEAEAEIAALLAD